jgi:anti-sigma B factor antagonist
MQILEDQIKDVYIFKISGRLNSNTAPELEKKFKQTIESGSNYMIIDFEKIEYLSSAGLRVILSAIKKLNRTSGKLVICSASDNVREVFQIAGFNSFLPIVPTLDDAVKNFYNP